MAAIPEKAQIEITIEALEKSAKEHHDAYEKLSDVDGFGPNLAMARLDRADEAKRRENHEYMIIAWLRELVELRKEKEEYRIHNLELNDNDLPDANGTYLCTVEGIPAEPITIHGYAIGIFSVENDRWYEVGSQIKSDHKIVAWQKIRE